jgi:hypothetical protein
MIAGGEGRRNRLEDLRATKPVVKIGVGTTADVDLVLMVDNQISGRVVDSSGKPMKERLRTAAALNWGGEPLFSCVKVLRS